MRKLIREEGFRPLFFYAIIDVVYSVHTIMDREKLKLMVRNLELLVDSIKAEVYSDVDAYKTSVDTNRLPGMNDYDEVFNDDDGYPD